jgi:hypothetical protein
MKQIASFINMPSFDSFILIGIYICIVFGVVIFGLKLRQKWHDSSRNNLRNINNLADVNNNLGRIDAPGGRHLNAREHRRRDARLVAAAGHAINHDNHPSGVNDDADMQVQDRPLTEEDVARQKSEQSQRAKMERRLAYAAYQASRTANPSRYSVLHRQKEEERERKEKAEEDELQRLEEEKRQAEEMEFNNWKDCMTIEGNGSLIKEQIASNNDEDFLQHVKSMKVIHLEDFASKYNIKVSRCVEKIKSLEVCLQTGTPLPT